MARVNQAMQDLLRYSAAILPQKRSTFDKSHSHTTTLDSGYIVPLMWDRVLPGDEKKIRFSGLARMATPLVPTMDEAKLDVHCFFVPDRLTWEHAREFYGENKDASFNPDGEFVMPNITFGRACVSFDTNDSGYTAPGIGSLNDYFGLPAWDNSKGYDAALDDIRINGLLYRGYQLIYNDYYRNSSVQPALQLSTGDDIPFTEWEVIRQIRKACKFPDVYTSLLREPQAGDDVLLPLGDSAPVVTRPQDVNTTDLDALRFAEVGGMQLPADSQNVLLGFSSDTDRRLMAFDTDNSVGVGIKTLVAPSNLWADLTQATSATINNLRAAITVQQLLEIDSIAGKRYQQILQAHFGVFTPDATLQRPELLGATRTSIGMRQVLQTSSGVEDSPLGSTGAFSLTSLDNEWICNKAFTEPGFIYVLGVIRPVHSYSQGIDPQLMMLQRYDHYWPVFDNLGNQPVKAITLFCTNTGSGGTADVVAHKDDIFGYAEAWTNEYRIKQNRVSGLMRPDVPGTLASWNYSSRFDRMPVLNSAFVEEDPNLIDRTIAVPSEPQFILDCFFDYKDTRSMGVHSVPGLTRL